MEEGCRRGEDGRELGDSHSRLTIPPHTLPLLFIMHLRRNTITSDDIPRAATSRRMQKRGCISMQERCDGGPRAISMETVRTSRTRAGGGDVADATAA